MPLWIKVIAWTVLVLTMPALFPLPTWKEIREDRTLRAMLALTILAVWILVIDVLTNALT